MSTTPFDEFIDCLSQGRSSSFIGEKEKVRNLLDKVYDCRYHSGKHYKERFQVRVNLQGKTKESAADEASYAGWITAENPTSGPYQGTSFVWFPGEKGSVAVLVIGTDGFGADTHILGLPGHGRRLRALNRLHRGKLWVKPDFFDMNSRVPDPTADAWPEIEAARKKYGNVIYAATAVKSKEDQQAVEDLLDLFFHEHGIPLTGNARNRWEIRLGEISGAIFPRLETEKIIQLIRTRRFVVLEGPPGTGKTYLAKTEIEPKFESATTIQFHPARTYEDFVVGLFPKPVQGGLAFEVKPGDLLQANEKAQNGQHLLIIDEINRADLSRLLGEAIILFEPSEDRSVKLPHVPDGFDENLALSKNLYILGTRNTADRTIARIDLAIRRRFAFVPVWPNRQPVQDQNVKLALHCFDDAIHTFAEFADDETLRLVPGQAYFLDPRPDGDPKLRPDRIMGRMKWELIPLLREYVSERLCGNASEQVSGLADRIESRLLASHG